MHDMKAVDTVVIVIALYRLAIAAGVGEIAIGVINAMRHLLVE